MKNLAHSAFIHFRETNAPSNPGTKHLKAAKRLLSPETDLPVRVAAGAEFDAKVVRQDVVVPHELGKWRLIGPPEPDLYPPLERHGRRNGIRVPVPQGKEAGAG